MDLTDRGSVTDTPYTIPNKKIIMEGGYQYITLQEDGPLSVVPAMEIDFGLPFNTEFIVELPTYYYLNKPRLTGFDTTSLGAKHELVEGKHSLVSIQGTVSLPGGSYNFGHHSTGGDLKMIGIYSFTPILSITAMFGLSTITEPNIIGGHRINSYNPSAVFTYQPIETINVFAEVYSESKTTIFGDSVLGIDTGLIYQITQNACLDFEFAKNLLHSEFNENYYLQGGITMLF